MLIRDGEQLEALSLVAELYTAAGDAAAFQAVLDRCHAWLRQPEVAGTLAAQFLRRQLISTREVARERRPTDDATTCAVISVDDRGAVLAAGREAWAVLHSGHPGTDELVLPAALKRQLAEAGAAGGQLPRALRVPLDHGSGEVAAVLLESSGISHAVGVVHVATFLLCAIPVADSAVAIADGVRRLGTVRPFSAAASGASRAGRRPRRAAAKD